MTAHPAAELATKSTQIRVESIAGSPTDEEVAAIVAAIEATSLRSVVVSSVPAGAPPWRFSSRWWRRPIPARRERPW